jgi:transposase
MVREPDATMQPTLQDNQLMSKHRVLGFKPQLRLEWRDQDGQNETKQPDHSASLGDFFTSSTRIRFSVHTARRGAACGKERLMITAGADLQVLVATRPVDFRKQADGLAAIVQAALGADPFCGAVFVFRSKRLDRVKLLWWDGTGICLMTKRLESGQFRWPPIEDGMMKLSAVQLAALLEGGQWARVERREVIRPSATQ